MRMVSIGADQRLNISIQVSQLKQMFSTSSPQLALHLMTEISNVNFLPTSFPRKATSFSPAQKKTESDNICISGFTGMQTKNFLRKHTVCLWFWLKSSTIAQSPLRSASIEDWHDSLQKLIRENAHHVRQKPDRFPARKQCVKFSVSSVQVHITLWGLIFLLCCKHNKNPV